MTPPFPGMRLPPAHAQSEAPRQQPPAHATPAGHQPAAHANPAGHQPADHPAPYVMVGATTTLPCCGGRHHDKRQQMRTSRQSRLTQKPQWGAMR